jgi:hypothetical protein
MKRDVLEATGPKWLDGLHENDLAMHLVLARQFRSSFRVEPQLSTAFLVMKGVSVLRAFLVMKGVSVLQVACLTKGLPRSSR